MNTKPEPWGILELTESRGVLILFGGLLLVLSSILEFVIGNTFSSVVFGHLGMFHPFAYKRLLEILIDVSQVRSAWLSVLA